MKISPFIFPLFSLRTVSVWSKNNPPEDNDGCDPCGLRDAENTFENFAFQTEVPNALSPGFKYVPDSGNRFTVDIGMATNHEPGFTFTSSTGNNIPAQSTIYGYGVDGEYTWPGKTFEVNRGVRYEVTWRNKIYPGPYILTGKGDYCEDSVVDTSLHWAYSVTAGSFEVDGVPIVTHLHGGHTDSLNDGNPEFYYNYDETVVGPQYVTSTYTYEDNIDATSLWYHDHALGITRLNVYAGLAGFYFVRDPSSDSGKWPNRLNLPVYPYEVALAIQDRMFKNDGSLFYPAFPGDPAYDDFIDCDSMEEVCEDEFGPTALAEFFGDHMVVNGKVWPKTDVEPRNYRLRLLNGCDSRYLVLEFVAEWSGDPLDFYVIGADQGFKTRGAGGIESQTQLVMGPGERFDVIINFSSYESTRVFLKNSGGDEPFGGLPAGKTSRPTSFVMAFDVGDCVDESQQENEFHIEEFNEWVVNSGHAPIPGNVARTRHVALFEGADEFGRLQPLLGTAEPATDHRGNPILWPIHTAYMSADLSGQVEGTVAWHTHPSTENPRKNDVEIWKIWNLSMDGHPIHLHLVDFEVLSRHEILFAINADDDNLCPEDSAEDPIGGVCLEPQPVVQHNGEIGNGFRIRYPEFCTTPNDCYSPEVVEHPYTDIGYPKDIVIANPGEVTVIKAKFDKTGHFVWHCHVLSHEDHEMMRVLYVGDEGA